MKVSLRPIMLNRRFWFSASHGRCSRCKQLGVVVRQRRFLSPRWISLCRTCAGMGGRIYPALSDLDGDSPIAARQAIELAPLVGGLSRCGKRGRRRLNRAIP
jgi:hypothetical protein